MTLMLIMVSIGLSRLRQRRRSLSSHSRRREIAKELLAVLRSQLGVNGEHVSSLEALKQRRMTDI
jgi:hypothetical protein